MVPPTTSLSSSLKVFGVLAFLLTYLLGCSSQHSSMTEADSSVALGEVEEVNDPEISGGDPGAPHDCVEEDGRPACQVRSRGTEFFAVKLRNERFARCLRPRGGSRAENIPIVLDTCRRTQSRLWKKEFNDRDRGPNKRYRFVNVFTGKCIKKVGTNLRQVTCSSSGVAPGGPETFQFQNTPPFGSGDFIVSNNTSQGGGCMQANNQNTATLTSGSSCNNDANRRWFQDLF